MKVKYFAYGSNMDKTRMEERVGSCSTPQPARLKGYKLVFNKPLASHQQSFNHNCGAAGTYWFGKRYSRGSNLRVN